MVGAATLVAGGTYGVVQGAEQGNAVGILAGAQAGQAFAAGNVVGGVLDLAQAATVGLSAAAAGAAAAAANGTGSAATALTLGTDAAIAQAAALVVGGGASLVQGAENGGPLGILSGVLALAAGAAEGVGVLSAGANQAITADALARVTALNSVGAVVSLGDQFTHGDLAGGLVQSLGLFLNELAADAAATGLGGPDSAGSNPFAGAGIETALVRPINDAASSDQTAPVPFLDDQCRVAFNCKNGAVGVNHGI